ncbi:MAG TPA: hypothetical protein VNC50_07375, partial [Planctomycetia bacterium]|nr:hypothetical protein [Planctomycetia bacterium]
MHPPSRFLQALPALGMLLALVLAGTGRAEDPVDDYLEALRSAGCADLGVEFLQGRLKSAALSDEERASYEFEIASLMLEGSRIAPDFAAREKILAESQRRFEEFTRTRANHPRQPEALAEMATVDLQRGRLKTVQAQLPSFSGQVGTLTADARSALLRASAGYEKAYKLISEARDKLPLPVEDDRNAAKLRKDRSRLFNRMIDARFQAAYALFLVAESYRTITPPKGMVEGKDPIRSREKELEYLKQAEERFAAIVTEYRQWLV